MAIQVYKYDMYGTGGGSRQLPWTTSGTITCEWTEVFDKVMKATFQALTEGLATYGEPGRCGGPYQITGMVIELAD